MSRVQNDGAAKRGRRVAGLVLGLLVGFSSTATMVNAQPTRKLPARNVANANDCVADELMIMPAAHVTDQDLDEILGAANCRVAGVMGKGAFRIIVVKTVKGKLAETEAKLRKDKHIGLIQRNYKMHDDALTVEDPIFKNGGDSFLSQIKVPKAWNLGAFGAGQTICIMDTGSQATTTDLAGKTDKGYDGTTLDAKAALFSSPIAAAAGIGTPLGLLGGLTLGLGLNLLSDAVNPGGQTDKDPDMGRRGHGTETATVAAGSINNLHGCGVAPGARIYPIHDGDSGGDDLAMLAGIYHLMTTPGSPRILSISQGGSEGIPDPGKRPIDHFFFRAFHDVFGGITFLSAGNNNKNLGGSQLGYANVVSAVDGNNHFDSSYSNFGGFVTFAGPGTVDSVTKYNEDAIGIQGTSFSTPACAGIAALVWAANPSLSNNQVEYIMKKTAFTPSDVASPDPTQYGYGIPDAEAAVKMATGQ